MENIPQSKLDRFSWLMTKRRGTVLILSIIVGILFACGIPRIQGEVRLYELYPIGHPYLQLLQKFSQVFGTGASSVVIAVKVKDDDIFNEDTLTKVQEMNNEVEMLDEVYRTLTISIANRSMKVVKAKGKGEISIEPLMWPDVPKNETDMEQLRRYIFSNPAYNGTFVSRDGTATMLITQFKEEVGYERKFEILRGIVERYEDEETSIHVVGFPMLMGWIYHYRPQIVMVSLISAGLMFLVLVLIFRNFGGIMAPTCFGIICTAMGLGFIGWTTVIAPYLNMPPINFSPLLYVLAFLVGARMISHSVQITHRYFEEYAATDNDKVQACYETMRKMLIPNWAGVATDAAGFLVLLFAKIILMYMVAIFMSFWMICISLCGILTPILCCYLPIGKASEQYALESEKLSFLDRLCLSCARFSIGSGKTTVAVVCIILFAFCTWEASRLKIGDPTPGTPLLWPEHTYNQDTKLMDSTFDMSSEMFLLFYEGKPGSVYDPVIFTTFEAFARHMQRELPDIYKSSDSLLNMVKILNETLRDGDKMWRQLPRNSIVLTGLLGYTRDNVDRGTLNRFMDATMERSQVTIFFADHTSENLLRIKKAAYEFFDEDHPMKIEQGEFMLAGGRVGMEIALNEEMKRSHAIIDSMVLTVIFILCSLAFYSLGCRSHADHSVNSCQHGGVRLHVAQRVSACPLTRYRLLPWGSALALTLPFTYTVGAWMNIPRQDNWENTILTAVRTSGKAVVYTGLTMILPIITWYPLSEMKFQAQMGIFLAMIIGANVIFSITLHPFMIYTLKTQIHNPSFIERTTILWYKR